MPRRIIRLYDLEELALIIEHPTGVFYTNQAGGVACVQPEIEGVLVPIGNACNVEDKLEAFFANATRLQPSDADTLDTILRVPEEPYVVTPTFFLEVDRSKLAESMEAWLHVTIVASPDLRQHTYRDGETSPTSGGQPWPDKPAVAGRADFYSFWGFGRCSGVLTWSNSD